jgi:hypothetical protein
VLGFGKKSLAEAGGEWLGKTARVLLLRGVGQSRRSRGIVASDVSWGLRAKLRQEVTAVPRSGATT